MFEWVKESLSGRNELSMTPGTGPAADGRPDVLTQSPIVMLIYIVTRIGTHAYVLYIDMCT